LGGKKSLIKTDTLKILAETEWFQLGPGGFETTFTETSDTALTALASELVDWRLMRYFQAKDMVSDLPEGVSLTEAAEDASPGTTQPGKGLELWQEYQRDQIAPYFGAVFNTGSWQAGIVVLKQAQAMILLVTMDKGSMSVGSHYTDQFASPTRFVWQTQTSTRRESLRGRIISGAEPDWTVHLFLRKSKLRDGRAAPFRYAGPVRFAGWEGEAPITVQWDLEEPVPKQLTALYGVAK
jgi:hypothetical protein